MSMGVVDDNDFFKELKNGSSDKTVLEVDQDGYPIPNSSSKVMPLPQPGRRDGDIEVPNSLRKIIGETSEIEGRREALDLARHLNISPSSVSAYANGATSTASYKDKSSKSSQALASHIQDRKDKVANTALSKMRSAMKFITEEKLLDCKPRELSGIAKDMAVVVKMMEPPTDSVDNNNIVAPQFIFYAPKTKAEETFDVIYAKE